jgi:hypothetical protein
MYIIHLLNRVKDQYTVKYVWNSDVGSAGKGSPGGTLEYS